MVGVAFAAVSALGAAGQFASGLMSEKARRAEFDQQIRALEMKKQQTLGLARARAAASGIEMSSSSTVDYLAGLANEFNTELGYLRSARRMTSKAAMVGNLAGLVGGGAQTYGQLGAMNNWWR